ncbi:integrase [Micromonospora sp. CPCC 205539]|uniref:integrase n=1 Tax=Micromonospora sp. CPCC 205539 TaxID=3122408 RepID=UPI002FF3E5DA
MRSRLRKLHVDGREFTWKADLRDTSGVDGRLYRCIRVRVWGAGKNGRALQADLTEWPYPAHWEEKYPYPTAENVRELARYAISIGWAPEAVGGTFRITAAADVALPGFAVTDLLSATEEPHQL